MNPKQHSHKGISRTSVNIFLLREIKKGQRKLEGKKGLRRQMISNNKIFHNKLKRNMKTQLQYVNEAPTRKYLTGGYFGYRHSR